MVIAVASGPVAGTVLLVDTVSSSGFGIATLQAATAGAMVGTVQAIWTAGATITTAAAISGAVTGTAVAAVPVIIAAQGFVLGSIRLILCGANDYN